MHCGLQAMIGERDCSRYGSYEEPELDRGLSGIFGDINRRIVRAVTPPAKVMRSVKKQVKYIGAAHVAPWVPASTTKKMFGLSDTEAKKFETHAKISRGIGIAVAAYFGGSYALSAGKGAGAGAGASGAGAGTTGAGTTAAAAGGTKAGFLATMGKWIGGAAMAGKFLGQKAQDVPQQAAQDFAAGYQTATGEQLQTGDWLSQLKGFGEKVKEQFFPQPAPESGGGYTPSDEGQAPAPIMAGSGLLLAAVAVGVGVTMLKGGGSLSPRHRRRR